MKTLQEGGMSRTADFQLQAEGGEMLKSLSVK